MEDLERKIKDCYYSKALSSKQLEAIVNTAGEKKKTRSFPPLLKYAAVLLVIIGSAYVFYFAPLQRQTHVLEGFAAEIAYNHTKKLPPAIKTNEVEKLNLELNELNFQIVLPDRITSSFTLLGGRYCSVNNRIAAQLKLKTKTQEIVTCYIFKKEERFNFDETIRQGNVKVEIWESDDLIYAIARDQ